MVVGQVQDMRSLILLYFHLIWPHNGTCILFIESCLYPVRVYKFLQVSQVSAVDIATGLLTGCSRFEILARARDFSSKTSCLPVGAHSAFCSVWYWGCFLGAKQPWCQFYRSPPSSNEDKNKSYLHCVSRDNATFMIQTSLKVSAKNVIIFWTGVTWLNTGLNFVSLLERL